MTQAQESPRSFAGCMTLNREFFWYIDHEYFFFLAISTGFYYASSSFPAGAITIYNDNKYCFVPL